MTIATCSFEIYDSSRSIDPKLRDMYELLGGNLEDTRFAEEPPDAKADENNSLPHKEIGC